MKLKIKVQHIALGILGIIVLVLAFTPILAGTRWQKSSIALGLLSIAMPFLSDIVKENKRQQEVEEKFLEFVRALSNSVKAGIPVPKSIKMISGADYGSLTPHVKKLARQLEWGRPLRDALMTFAKDTKNKLIKKSVVIVIEAEKSGGNIQVVLSAVTSSVLQMKKIKEERKSMVFAQILQGYIVFFIFIGIMIVLMVYLLPQLEGTGGMIVGQTLGDTGGGMFGTDNDLTIAPSQLDYDVIFTALILIQGFFAGLIVGKFSEGEFKYGIKHALIMIVGGYLLFATATGL